MQVRMLPGLILLLAVAVGLVLPQPPQAAVPAPSRPLAGTEPPVDEQLHRRIDEWIRGNGLNPYGDPQGTMYSGGTPLFDESTGITKDRYQYILEQHPELKDDGPRKR